MAAVVLASATSVPPPTPAPAFAGGREQLGSAVVAALAAASPPPAPASAAVAVKEHLTALVAVFSASPPTATPQMAIVGRREGDSMTSCHGPGMGPPPSVEGVGGFEKPVGQDLVQSRPTANPFRSNMPKFRIFRFFPVVIHL